MSAGERCVICGRLPYVACCEICHRVHRALWQDVSDHSDSNSTSLARRVLAGLDDAEMNTEAVNQ